MRRHRALRRAGVLLLAVAAVTVGTGPPAQARWSVPGAGTPPEAAQAVRMPTGITPTVVGTGSVVARTFTVSWTAPTGTSIPIEGYQVTRSSSLLGAGLISGGTCVGGTTLLGLQRVVVSSVTTTSCTDIGVVNLGTVQYTVTPVYRKWVGVASAWSSATT